MIPTKEEDQELIDDKLSRKITNLQELQAFIKLLPKCETISSKLLATQNLLDIAENPKDIYLYKKFIEMKGLLIFSGWIKEYKNSVQKGTDLTKDEEIIVVNIVCLCDKMNLSIRDLKSSKIGKNINSLTKLLGNEKIPKAPCSEIVAKWRFMIESNEENEKKEKEKIDKEKNNNIGGNDEKDKEVKDNSKNGILMNMKTKRKPNNFSNNNNINSKINRNHINNNSKKMYVIFQLFKISTINFPSYY